MESIIYFEENIGKTFMAFNPETSSIIKYHQPSKQNQDKQMGLYQRMKCLLQKEL